VYLASHGARTPFLAVLALRRPRVLLVVLVPAIVLVVAARLAGSIVDPPTAIGMLALASAPGALALGPQAGTLGGRRDTAGAFLLGTMVVWVVLVVIGAPGGSAALPGIQSFALAAGVAAGADDPQLAAWKSGKIAIIDMCGCDLQTYGLDNQFEWDVAAWPKGPERLVSTLNLDVGAIVAASSQPEAAFEALRFLLVEPANARRLSTRGYGAMSPLRSEQGAFLAELKDRFPGVDLQVFLEAFPYSINQEGWFPAFAEVGDLGGQFLDPVALGQSTAAEQLPMYQEAGQKLVDRWFQENELPS